MAVVRTALVIGGGIAGLVTALALQQAGIEATVYEAYADLADTAGGALMVAPNGLDALRIVGVDEALLAVGQPMRRQVMSYGTGRRLGEIPALRGLPPSQAMFRGDLCRVIHEQAAGQGISIEYGKRLVGVEEGSAGVTAQFADGTTASADVLIGADGIGSIVRTLIDPDAPGPQHAGLLSFGGFAAKNGSPASADTDVMHFVLGKRAFFGYWTAFDGRTLWFSNLPHADPMTSAEARKIPSAEWLRQLGDIYAEDIPGRDVVARTDPDDLIVLGSIEAMPSVPLWHRGRMVLTGDSAHAPSSSSGQGVSLAVESAIELARCLRDLPDLPAAFAAYERLRRDRVEKIAATAAKTNNQKSGGPVGRTLVSLLAPVAMKTFLSPEKMFGPVQRHQINWAETVVGRRAT